MKRTHGFTLIELLVVMAILGILAAAVMPLGHNLLQAQKEQELRTALRSIRNAIDDYKRAADAGAVSAGDAGYPASLSVLVNGVPDQRASSNAKTLYFLRSLPRDPFADPILPAEQSWQLRSYASPPGHPKPGADVFDVHSSSKATALDGTPYAQW